MFIRLLIIFTLIPVMEICVLLQVGSKIGPIPTVTLILATGFAGAYLARSEGLEILHQIHSELAGGFVPAAPLLEGAIILAGATLLITPGFCTDTCGFLLLIPSTRTLTKRLVKRWLQDLLAQGKFTIIKP